MLSWFLSIYIKVQVQQLVIDIITHIASTASKYPKKCVVLCLQGHSPLFLFHLPSFISVPCYLFFGWLSFSFKVTLLFFFFLLPSYATVPCNLSYLVASLYHTIIFLGLILSCNSFLSGVSERVADIKTRAQAMKCLTTFCEAVGPGFVFERVSKVLYMQCFLVLLHVRKYWCLD